MRNNIVTFAANKFDCIALHSTCVTRLVQDGVNRGVNQKNPKGALPKFKSTTEKNLLRCLAYYMSDMGLV